MQLDRTKNMAGPENRPPLLPLAKCFNQNLVDGFVADGWIAPEHRDRKVIALYQGQMAAERRQHLAERSRREAEVYAAGWVERWIDDPR